MHLLNVGYEAGLVWDSEVAVVAVDHGSVRVVRRHVPPQITLAVKTEWAAGAWSSLGLLMHLQDMGLDPVLAREQPAADRAGVLLLFVVYDRMALQVALDLERPLAVVTVERPRVIVPTFVHLHLELGVEGAAAH